MRKTEVEIKREMHEKIAPELKTLIKKYGYENVAYSWNKAIAKQREISKAEQAAQKALAEVEKLKRQQAEL